MARDKYQKYDWDALEKEYMETDISYPKLAQKYNIPKSTVMGHGKKYGWGTKKRLLKTELWKEKMDIVATEAAKKDMNKLVRMQEVAEKMLEVLEQKVSTMKNDYVTAKECRDLTSAVKDMTTVIRNVYDIPTQAEIEAQKLARDKFNLEAKKAETETNVGTIRVIFDDIADGILEEEK